MKLLHVSILSQWWVYSTGGQEEEDRKALLCDKCDRAITCMFCCDHDLTPMFSSPLQKDVFKGNWSLVKSCFKPNLCHTYCRRFAIFFPLPSCCISSLMWKMFLFKYHCVKFWCRYIVYNNSMTGYWLCR